DGKPRANQHPHPRPKRGNQPRPLPPRTKAEQNPTEPSEAKRATPTRPPPRHPHPNPRQNTPRATPVTRHNNARPGPDAIDDGGPGNAPGGVWGLRPQKTLRGQKTAKAPPR